MEPKFGLELYGMEIFTQVLYGMDLVFLVLYGMESVFLVLYGMEFVLYEMMLYGLVLYGMDLVFRNFIDTSLCFLRAPTSTCQTHFVAADPEIFLRSNVAEKKVKGC